ncbi:CARDB domain-containing protein [Candidatus Chloroploca asiatica]|uniref:CARDB domain-containing protein n=1 Tax=Candidatus Chloroploca asiatica TaxID=1506545 RepID=A0A2H3KH99_9CHLR|nr:CARDB domain-containing protein [Candidatus Chloroploca asiatica]PDV97123.1 hypothetical protein A9Q02_19245 [Candidatus Chloroploca asiatica]
MTRHHLLLRSVSLMLAMAMVITSLVPLVDAYQKTSGRMSSIGGGIRSNLLAPHDVLFRTEITVQTPAQWARLETLGVTILAHHDVNAIVLVDYEQLADLARLRFQPTNSTAYGDLLHAGTEQKPWLIGSLRPLSNRVQRTRVAIDSPLAMLSTRESPTSPELLPLRTAVQQLSPEQRTALSTLPSLDDDGDGLTNTEEGWWCTDPLNANSDGDAQGYTDGQEVSALIDVTQPRNVRWGYGPPFGPPNAWPNFNNRDGTGVKVCNDGDFDTIPDYAEVFMVGTRVPYESTDNDKFDDGQELFGVTYCPGAPTNCGYGSYPAVEYWNFIKAPMPNWVLSPGDSPFVAAFPVPEVTVEANSWTVERVTTITTSQGEMVETTNSYETAVTRGQSTSIANTVTWNEWEEVSEAIETPLARYGLESQAIQECTPVGSLKCRTWGATKVVGGNIVKDVVGDASKSGAVAGFWIGCTVGGPLGCIAGAGAGYIGGALLETWSEHSTDGGWADLTAKDAVESQNGSSQYPPQYTSSSSTSISSSNASASIVVQNNNNIDMQGVVNSLDGVQYAINQQGQLLSRGLQDISYAISQPRLTETRTSGKSWGGAQTTTHEVYEEHTISEGEAFTSGQNWSTAWAVDSSHAADLTFRYSVRNAGTEYARELSNLVVNIYIGDDKLPTISYPAWQQFADGKLENLFPVGPNTPPGVVSTRTFASNAIPLSLEQMKRIDLGERLTVKVESYSFGADELFYTDAINGGVTVFIEDGVEDGDETVDQYVIPTWGAESVQDVLMRYFPHAEDVDGNLNSLWTPEFNGINAPTWHEHYLSDIAWWNVYLTQADAGDTPLHQLPSRAGSGILFRFNRDSDRDGYNDRAEFRYYCSLPANHDDRPRCSDAHLRPEIHPQPEVLAGYVVERSGNIATVKLALENTGTFDAYGIDAVMYSPDETTTIGNNTVGGNGKVRPGNKVTVGSIIKAPDLSNWGASRARPYAAGEYSGAVDRTLTFTAQTPGVVGTGSTAVAWNDGAGASGVLQLGGSYRAPLPLDVAHGVQVGFNTGTIDAGARFSVQALTSRDTFTYTINSEPFIPPVIVVSYSDPQGSHRFVTPVQLPALGDSLVPHIDAMLEGLELKIVSTASFITDGTNTTNLVVYNPHPATIQNGHLHLNFVSDGTLVLEKSYTLDLPAGPTTFAAAWSVTEFSADYNPDGDNLLIAFWTDSENNIIDSAARPLSSFQADPSPKVATDETRLTWDFGEVSQGTLLKHRLALANVGTGSLQAYLTSAPGLSLGSRPEVVDTADLGYYELILRTAELPVGPYDQVVTVRTSDPDQPILAIRIQGTVRAISGDIPGGLQRPLDVQVAVQGPLSQGYWVPFTHSLGPAPESLHPVRVYAQDYSTLYGVGKYATDFGAGTASYDMFGDGRDGAMPGSGNLDNNNGFGIAVVNSGSAGATSINVTDVYAGWRINPGDAVLIHQAQGAGAGCWEMNKAVSDYVGADYVGGTAAIQLEKPLKCNYASGGNNRAQVLRVPQYSTCNVTGTVTPLYGWNGSSGGIFAVMCNEAMTISGGVVANGGNGATASDGFPSGGSGAGFRGGQGDAVYNDNYGCGHAGEGTPGIADCNSHYPNGNGGAAGSGNPQVGNYGTGGGGGNGTAGGNSTAGGIGVGGYVAGNAELTNIVFGGGGGGSNDNPGNSIGGGGGGGGIVVLSARTLSISGLIQANGGQGGGNKWGAGGGSGGSVLIRGDNLTLNTQRISVLGGAARMNGGAGGLGRIRVEYCTSATGYADAGGTPVKINCYVAEQTEAAPYTTGRLNLPEPVPVSKTYQVQYGRRLIFSGSASQATTLRVGAGMFSTATLQALVSGLPTNASFALDIGANGSNEWEGTVANISTNNSPNLATAFNAYWASQGAPVTGSLDVPVRVTLSQPGQVLISNLHITTAGSKQRTLRMNAGTVTEATLELAFGGSGQQNVSIAVDVGADGSLDWIGSVNTTLPKHVTTGNIANALSAFLAQKSGMVDIPLRIFVAPDIDVKLYDANITIEPMIDLIPEGLGGPVIAVGVQQVGSPSFTEGDMIPVQTTLTNLGSQDSGSVTVAFYAYTKLWGDMYIGSTFVPNVSAGSSIPTILDWNTLGFTGLVTITAVVDPYNRVVETDKTNNTASAGIPILTRPDLSFTAFNLSNAEPMAGEPVEIVATLANHGQTAAGTQAVALYRDNPDGGGLPLQAQTVASVEGEATHTVSFTWTPEEPGMHRLFLRADRDAQVNESDKSNNDRWLDVYVGFASPLDIDSGRAGDTVYSSAQGYGAVDRGEPDETGNCGEAPHQYYRRDPSGRVVYRFDHLLPGHFYHLDLVLYECGQNAGRQQRVSVDGIEIAGPVDLGSGEVQNLSLLLDPALYADRSIEVAVTVDGSGGAIVNQIALVDVDYRYADAGGASDVRYPTGARAYGWLDGVAQTPWGTLPYRSLRENQSGNEVRYRFDALDPNKAYRVHFSFFLGSGNNRVQQIWIDDIPLSGDFTLVAGQRNDQRVDLPRESYADGSIVVAVRRADGAATGALINEVALEELTQRQTVTCQVTPTPSWSVAFGNVTVAGQPAPAGTVITAETPRGEVVGCFVVESTGQYGFMSVYGEDATGTPVIPGMRPGEPVVFRVNGAMAVPTPQFTWQDNKTRTRIDLAAGITQSQYTLLRPNWNLVSTRMTPPVPLLDIVFRSIAGKYCLVLGARGIYDCNLPPGFQSLKEITPGKAYYTRITGGASVNLVVEGIPLSADTPITLERGLNWVGYLPTARQPVTTTLASINDQLLQVADGQGRIYDPAEPEFSTLQELVPGQGYLVHLSSAATLVYPTTTAATIDDPSPMIGADGPITVHCGGVEPTPYFTAIYGKLTIDGAAAMVGSRVEAYTPRGDMAGCFTVTKAGQYGFLTIFGADSTADGLPGFLDGEPIHLRVDGVTIELNEPLIWQNDQFTRRLNLEMTTPDRTLLYLPLIRR